MYLSLIFMCSSLTFVCFVGALLLYYYDSYNSYEQTNLLWENKFFHIIMKTEVSGIQSTNFWFDVSDYPCIKVNIEKQLKINQIVSFSLVNYSPIVTLFKWVLNIFKSVWTLWTSDEFLKSVVYAHIWWREYWAQPWCILIQEYTLSSSLSFL